MSEAFIPDYSPWRHGGWYVNNIRYPSGAIGCVSNNYPDKKWRVVCGGFEHLTFSTRRDAANAEHLLVEGMEAAATKLSPIVNPTLQCALRAAWLITRVNMQGEYGNDLLNVLDRIFAGGEDDPIQVSVQIEALTDDIDLICEAMLAIANTSVAAP
jgi:hypothetical protein